MQHGHAVQYLLAKRFSILCTICCQWGRSSGQCIQQLSMRPYSSSGQLGGCCSFTFPDIRYSMKRSVWTPLRMNSARKTSKSKELVSLKRLPVRHLSQGEDLPQDDPVGPHVWLSRGNPKGNIRKCFGSCWNERKFVKGTNLSNTASGAIHFRGSRPSLVFR